MCCFDFEKDISKVNNIAQMDLAEYLRKSDVLQNSKSYYHQLLRNGLHKRYCCINKSR